MDPKSNQAVVPSSDPDFQIEAFAHAIAFGVPMTRALAQAGYEKPSSSLGYLLMKDQRVIDIIESDRHWLREKLQQSKEALAMQLDHDREFAYAEGNPSAAVAATLGKARIFGFMDVGAANRAPSKITIEWGPESTEVIHEKVDLVPAEDLND